MSFRFCLRILFSKWSKSHKFLKFFDRRNKPKVKKKKKVGREAKLRDLRNKAKSRSKLRSFKLWLEVWGCCLSLQNANRNSILAAKATKTKLSPFLVWFCKSKNGSRASSPDLKRWWYYWRPLRQSYDRRSNGTAQATDFCLCHHLSTARWDAQGRNYPTGPRRLISIVSFITQHYKVLIMTINIIHSMIQLTGQINNIYFSSFKIALHDSLICHNFQKLLHNSGSGDHNFDQFSVIHYWVFFFFNLWGRVI